MEGRFNKLAQQIFQKPFEDCHLEELRNFADQYPYFAPAHFLLLDKLPVGSDESKVQYQKAILYYHDPEQFSAFLNPPASDPEYHYTDSEPAIAPREPIDETDVPEPGILQMAKEAEPSVTPGEEEVPQPEAERETPEAAVPLPALEEPLPEEPKAIAPIQEEVQALTFEPFHTVDYFASQGIKLALEELPKDQLGKQMKSFTEWLKTMKRLPATQLVKAVDSHAEKKVENLAEHSVLNADVVTEAMAEVWLRQGQPYKALDIYNKLSLQNHSKRAYFAAKIENLKKSL